jgi:exonuclease VII small subunit
VCRLHEADEAGHIAEDATSPPLVLPMDEAIPAGEQCRAKFDNIVYYTGAKGIPFAYGQRAPFTLKAYVDFINKRGADDMVQGNNAARENIKAVPQPRDFDKLQLRYEDALDRLHKVLSKLRVVRDRLTGSGECVSEKSGAPDPEPTCVTAKLDRTADYFHNTLTSFEEELKQLEQL